MRRSGRVAEADAAVAPAADSMEAAVSGRRMREVVCAGRICDGGLVGGASLVADEFLAICRAACNRGLEWMLCFR